MAHKERAFADSNFFIAFFNISDKLHQRAKTLAKELLAQNTQLVISNYIFLEVVTVLSQRVGKFTALEVGKYFIENSSIQTIHIDEELQRYSWKIFQEVKDKNIGFVDCSIIAAMKAEGISHLLTFDIQDFQKLKKSYRFQFF